MKTYRPTTRTNRRRRAHDDEIAIRAGGERQTARPLEQSLALLRHPQAGRAELASLQQRVGNARVQRALATPVIQRAPEQAVESPDAAASQAVAQQSTGSYDAVVQAKLEEFLQRFSNIPVVVRWEEGGEKKTATVNVHPPYFINTDRYAASKKRLEAAQAARKAATGSAEKAPVKASWAALHGKSTPEEFKRILQEAVDSGKIPTPAGKKHPDAGDLRAWLVKYGIGVDCSGFVSQALNEVMAKVHEQAGVSMEGVKKVNLGSGGLKGGSKDFSTVAKPDDLRPGDTMYIPGHIRIVMGVEKTSDGVVFTTAESRAGGKDVGPDRAVWRYKDSTAFEKLEKKSGNAWSKSSEKPVFGRSKALAAFQAEHVPVEQIKEERKTNGSATVVPAQTPADGALLDGLVETAKELGASVVEVIDKLGDWTSGLFGGATPDSATGSVPQAAQQAEAGKAALAQALATGMRDATKLTDLVFHARHAELRGRRIKASEKALAEEWKRIRDAEVQPALHKAQETPAQDGGASATPDPEIDRLHLEPDVAEAARVLKSKSKGVKFTSGRRGVKAQARAMAQNIVHSNNRQWIAATYASAAKLQQWLDEHPEAETVAEIAQGLEDVMNGMSPAELHRISKHLTGRAFDVQPGSADKQDIQALPGLKKFITNEGGLERWHLQF